MIESQSLSGKSVVGCLILHEKTKLIRAEMFPFPSSQMLSVQSSFKGTMFGLVPSPSFLTSPHLLKDSHEIPERYTSYQSCVRMGKRH